MQYFISLQSTEQPLLLHSSHVQYNSSSQLFGQSHQLSLIYDIGIVQSSLSDNSIEVSHIFEHNISSLPVLISEGLLVNPPFLQTNYCILELID